MLKILLDLLQNRVLNKHTPKGITLLVIFLGGIEYLKNNKGSLLSIEHITYIDVWILGINLALAYVLYRGIKLILRCSDCLFEEKIIKKFKKNTNKKD